MPPPESDRGYDNLDCLWTWLWEQEPSGKQSTLKPFLPNNPLSAIL